jgi:hypothetical protein
MTTEASRADPAEVERVLREAVMAAADGHDAKDCDGPDVCPLPEALDAYAAFVRAVARRTEAACWREEWLSGRLDGHKLLTMAEAELQRQSDEVMRPAAQEAE